MLKAFGLVMMLLALYFGMQLYTKDMERVVEHVDAVTGSRDEGSGEHRGTVTQRVRDKVTADIARGAARYGE